MNPRNFGLAGGLGELAGGLFGMGNSAKNPYDDASRYYNQIPGKTAPYYAPYQQAGQNALGQLQGQYGNLLGNYGGIQSQYNNLMNDPTGFMAHIGSQYQKSPGYDWQLNQGLNAASNAAAAGGMLGSPQHQQQAAGMAEGLANQDYYNYLNHALGIYGTGLEGNQGLYGTGLSGMQNMNQMGFNANDQMARMMADNLAQQGQMSYLGNLAQNQNQGNVLGDVFGGLASIIGWL